MTTAKCPFSERLLAWQLSPSDPDLEDQEWAELAEHLFTGPICEQCEAEYDRNQEFLDAARQALA
jgi:hypothetical protein